MPTPIHHHSVEPPRYPRRQISNVAIILDVRQSPQSYTILVREFFDKHPRATCIEGFPYFFNVHEVCLRSGSRQRAEGEGLELRSRSETAMLVETLARSRLQGVCNMTISNRGNALRCATLDGKPGSLKVYRGIILDHAIKRFVNSLPIFVGIPFQTIQRRLSTLNRETRHVLPVPKYRRC